MIGIISQVRMTSTRLPAKVMKAVNGIPLLQYHVDRLRKSDFPVYIATTTNKEDDPIEEFCVKNQINFFRGSEHDVLSRYHGLANKFDLKVIVRVTSDCPLIDGQLIRSSYLKHQRDLQENFYLCNTQKRTYPRGFDFEIFSRSTLEEMFSRATLDFEKEHVTPYIWKSHPEKFSIIHITRPDDASEFRITVDEPDDFKIVEKLILEHQAHLKTAEEIIAILRRHPELKEINAHVEQKKV